MTRDGSVPPPAKKRGPYKKIPADLRGEDGPRVAQMRRLARQVIEAKAANNGRLPRGFYPELLNEQTEALNSLLKIEKEDIRNEVKRTESAAKSNTAPSLASTSSSTVSQV